jgi:hypothetical protein
MQLADAERTLLGAWEVSSAQLAEVSVRAAEALHRGGGELASDWSDTQPPAPRQQPQVEVLAPSGVWRLCTVVRTERPPHAPEEAIVVHYLGFGEQHDESIAAGEWAARLRIHSPN